MSSSTSLLENGSVMQLLTGSPPADVSVAPIFLWWEPDVRPSKLGALHFNHDVENKQKTKVDGQSLPLNKISDVFSGKQQPLFKSAAAANFPSEQCLTLGAKTLPLHLVAESAEVRAGWIAGIKSIFAAGQAAKKAEKEAAAAAAANGTTSAASTTAPAAGAAAAGAAAEAHTDNIRSMIAGQQFISLSGGVGDVPSSKADLFVFLDPSESKCGVLYSNPIDAAHGQASKFKDDQTAMHMHRVSDVFLGKRAPEFSAPEVANYPSLQCFSLVSKDRSLHLVAPSEQVRTQWLAGVKEIFDIRKKQAAKKAEAAAAAAAAASAADSEAAAAAGNQAASTTASSPVAATATAPPNVLAEGKMYRSVVLDSSASGGARASDVFLWHDPADGKLGTIYYSSTAGDKTKSADKALPVAKIKDVFLGRQAAEFKTEFAKDVPSGQCFSLMLDKEKGEGLHLIAENDQQRNATLATIKGFWVPKPKKTAAAPAAAGGTNVAAAAAQQPGLTTADQAALLATQSVTAAPTSQQQPRPAALDVGQSAQSSPQGSPMSPTSPATASRGAEINARVAADPALNIETMTKGSAFRQFDLTLPKEQALAQQGKEVVVFLSQEGGADGNIGSLYWNEAVESNGERTKSSERQLPLAKAQDVYAGTHAWKKAGLTPAPVQTLRALSIVTSSNTSLHLEAHDEETRARWAVGIRNLFERQQAKNEENRRLGAAGGLAVSPRAADQPRQRQSVALLAAGASFTSYSLSADGSRLESKPVFLFFDPKAEKLGTMYWCDDGKREVVEGQSIPMHKISDVFLGKHSSIKERPELKDVRTAHMFTLASRHTGVHLAARDAEQRAKWIDAIKGLFTTSGKRVDETQAVPGRNISKFVFPDIASSPRGGEGFGSSGAASPRTLARERALPAVAIPVSEGTDFDLWSLNESGDRSSSRPVHVWYEQDGSPLGVLYWSNKVGERLRVPGQQLHLHEVTDVIFGKSTEEFKHRDAADVASDRCISLRSTINPDCNLNLVAANAQAQRRWARGLQAVFTTETNTKVESRRFEKGSVPAEAVTSPRATRVLRQKQLPLTQGQEVTMVEVGGKRTEVILWLDTNDGRAGTLYWAPRGGAAGSRVKNAEDSIAVHTIRDFYLGRKTPALRAPSCATISSKHAFGVSSRHRTFSGYTRSEAERKIIVEAIEASIAQAGTPVKELRHPTQNAVEANATLLAQTAIIQQGSVVLLHSLNGPPRQVYLWYEPHHGKLGCLFWTPVVEGQKPERRRDGRSQMLVQHISDVMIARQSKVLKAAKPETGAHGSNTFSLHTQGALALDLQLKSRAERDTWLNAIRAIFAQTQKRIVEGAGSASAFRLKKGDTVDTWFGRGVVVEETRAADGIAKIDVGGTTCFFNGESAKPVQTIYTPFGRGVPPVGGSKVRPDGIRRVELPWATAYLNTESASERDPASADSGMPMHQSREDSVRFLQQGLTFQRVTTKGAQESNFVSFNPEATRKGSLEFRKAAGGPLDGTVALREITDLLVGRLTPNLQAQGEEVKETQAFSIVGRNLQVDLIAPSDQARQDFIYALFNLLTTSGSGVSAQRAGSPASPGLAQALSPIAGRTARRYSFSKPLLPAFSDAEELLSRGAEFQILVVRPDGTRESSMAAMVFLDSRDDRLYWTPTATPGKRTATRAVDLSQVADVWHKKKTPAFMEPAFRGTPDNLCFSIGTRDETQWNLVAHDTVMRDRFFFALQTLLTSKDRQERLRDALEFAQAALQQQSAWSPRGGAAGGAGFNGTGAGAASGNVADIGVMATLWSGEGDNVKGERVYLFRELDGTKYGSLYWNSAAGDRHTDESRRMALHGIRDVFLGKVTPTAKSEAMLLVPKSRVLSLVNSPPQDGSTPASLNVELDSMALRTELLKGLKEIWSATKAKSPTSPGVLKPAAQQPIGGAAAQPVPVELPQFSFVGNPITSEFAEELVKAQPRALYAAPLFAVGFLQHGVPFVRTADNVALDVFYVAAAGFEAPFGALYWSTERGSRNIVDEQAVHIHRIERVRVADDARTVVIETSSNKLSVRAQSAAHLAAFLAGLQYVLQASGFRVTQNAEGVFVVNDRDALNSPSVALSVPAADSARFVSQGVRANALFPSYGAKGLGVAKTPITLFFDEGALWVSPLDTKEKNTEDDASRFPLTQIKRVSTGGKFGPLALTVQTRDNFLDVELVSFTELSLFLAGFTALTEQAGLSVSADREDSGNSTDRKRAYVLTSARERFAPTHAAGASPVDLADAVSPRSEDAAVAEFNAKGAHVVAYTLQNGKNLLHKDLDLWIGEENGIASLHWGPADDEHVKARMPDEDNTLEIDEVQSVQVGKFTPVLLALGDEHAAPSANCLSITSATAKLHLVAASAAHARGIVQAIKARNPKGLVVKH